MCLRFPSPLPQNVISELGESMDSSRNSLGLDPKTIVTENEVQFQCNQETDPVVMSKVMEGWQFQRKTNSGKVSETLSLSHRELTN